MARPKKVKDEVEEALTEALEAQQEPVETPVQAVNNELQELLLIHNAMTVKGIKDIGQLEVLISRLQ